MYVLGFGNWGLYEVVYYNAVARKQVVSPRV